MKFYIYIPHDGEAAYDWSGGLPLNEAKEAARGACRVLHDAGCFVEDTYVSVRDVATGNEVWGCDSESCGFTL